MKKMHFVFVHICSCSPHEWPGLLLGITSLHVHLGSSQGNAASCLLLCGMIRVMLNSVWAKVWELDSPAYETSMVLHRIPKNSIRLHRIRNDLNNMNWDYMWKNVGIGLNSTFSRIAHGMWNKSPSNWWSRTGGCQYDCRCKIYRTFTTGFTRCEKYYCCGEREGRCW